MVDERRPERAQRKDRRPGERSKTTVTYRRTPRGDAHLNDLVRRGLRSPGPIYSNRLVGAAFGRGPEIAAALGNLAERRDAVGRRTRGVPTG